MEGTSVAKVGLLVLLAIVLAAGGYYYLSHKQFNTYMVKVRFKDTRGLLKQSVVRLKGVGIGEVTSVDLEDTAGILTPTVRLAISDRYRIPTDYNFVITSGLLISNPTIEVRPPDPPAQTANANPPPAESIPPPHYLPQDNSAVVDGAATASALDALDPQLTKTVKNLNGSFGSINAKLDSSFKKINILLDRTNKLVANSDDAITKGKSLLTDPRLKDNLLVTTENFKQLSIDTRRTTAALTKNLTSILNTSRPKLDKLTDQGIALVGKLSNSIDNVNVVVKRLTDQVSDPRLQSSLQETIELARSTLSSTRQLASDVHQLTGDPALQNNLKESAANLRLTTERSASALDKLNGLLDKVSGAVGKVRAPKIPPVQLLLNAQEAVDPGRFRLDADVRVPIGRRNLVDAGLFDLGENTRLNLQVGTRFSDSLLARYGIHASKLGVGVEFGHYPYSGIRTDLYDVNHPRLDVRGLIRVNKNASIWAGADGFFRGDPIPTVGIQINN